MSYQLELSPCSRFVSFRPYAIGGSADEITRRRTAISALASRYSTNKVLMDYRKVALPLGPELFDAAIAAPELRARGKWRVAFLVSLMSPGYSIDMVRNLADLVLGLGQDAQCFTAHEAAVGWLNASVKIHSSESGEPGT